MKADSLIQYLRGAGVVLSAQNKSLYIDAPEGVITSTLKEQLQTLKLEIIKTLQPKKTHEKPKIKTYQTSVRGKIITVMDPTGKSEAEMKRSLQVRFGDNLDLMV